MSAEYNFRFRIDWNVPRFDLDLTAGYIGQVKVLGYPVVGSPTQEQINIAVAEYIEEHPGAAFGISEEVKQALLQIARKVWYVDGDGQEYYQDLYDALYPPVDLVSISAVYTQTGAVYDTDSLDSLKDDLVVTATYTDASTAVIPAADYTLSGSLSVGTSTITVSYGGKTTTFTVTVITTLLYNWDFTQSLTDSVGGVTATLTGATQDSNGIHITGATQRALLGDVFGYDRTMEIDYTDASIAFGSGVNGIWFWTDAGQSTHSGFGYHYSSSASQNKYGFYSHDVAHWAVSSAFGKTSFDGSGTIKCTVDSDGIITVYKDGVNLALKYNGAAPYVTREGTIKRILLGSAYSSYPAYYNVYITAVRIYEGVR